MRFKSSVVIFMAIVLISIAIPASARPSYCGYCVRYEIDGTQFETCNTNSGNSAETCWVDTCYGGGMCPQPPRCYEWLDNACGTALPPDANGHALSSVEIGALSDLIAQPFVMTDDQREEFWRRVDARVADMSPEDAAAETGTMMHLEVWRLKEKADERAEAYGASLAARAIRVFGRMR
jgi:hypothetical protein